MKGDKLIRAALYGRVSTTDKGQDPEVQLGELRRAASDRSWTVADEHVYVDRGFSGIKASRPALDRLMADVRAGKLDVIAVFRFDRFARSTQHLLSALDEFGRLGVQFVSICEQIDTGTAMGKAMFTIVAAIAELEREILRERVIAGVRKAQGDGKHCGRPLRAFDPRAADILLGQGHAERQVAQMLGLPRSTLRRKLAERSGT